MAEDLVNHLPHYEKGGIETIDFIKAKDCIKISTLPNVIKYISRAKYKRKELEDLKKKAKWYLKKRAISLLEKKLKHQAL